MNDKELVMTRDLVWQLSDLCKYSVYPASHINCQVEHNNQRPYYHRNANLAAPANIFDKYNHRNLRFPFVI